MILTVQKRVLDHLLHPRTLQRIGDSQLYGNDYVLSEMLDDLSSAIFDADMRGSVNGSRQNLQVEDWRLAAIWQGKAAKNFSHLARSAVLAQLQQLAKG